MQVPDTASTTSVHNKTLVRCNAATPVNPGTTVSVCVNVHDRSRAGCPVHPGRELPAAERSSSYDQSVDTGAAMIRSLTGKACWPPVSAATAPGKLPASIRST